MDSDVLQSTLDDLSYLVIPPSHLTLENDIELGCGGYGEVYLALLTRSTDTPPQRVAVKQLRIVQAKEVRRRIAFRLVRELKVWAASKHPNILELVGFYLAENHGSAQFVSAYMAHGNVKDYIKLHQPTVAVRLNFVQGITSGINYLHSYDPPICHGDLKPSNVLVNDNIEAVLCDFGLATFIEASGVSSGLTTSKSVKGSTRYMSPELLQDTGAKHTLGSDVWAWACTAFEVVTNYQPYHTAMGDVSVMKALVLGKCPGSVEMISDVALDNDPTCHRVLDPLKCIITECWAFDPNTRPCSSEIMNRVFFQCDTKPSDAPSVLSEPPPSEPMPTVGFSPIEDKRREDQNSGHLSLPTELGSRDSHFTPSPISQDPPMGPNDGPASEMSPPPEDDGNSRSAYGLSPFLHTHNIGAPQESMDLETLLYLPSTPPDPFDTAIDGNTRSEDGASPLPTPPSLPTPPPLFFSEIIDMLALSPPPLALNLGPRADIDAQYDSSSLVPRAASNPEIPSFWWPPNSVKFPVGTSDLGDGLPAPAAIKRSEGFICQVPSCGRVCKSTGGLKRHSRTHEARSLCCNKCRRIFHRASDLDRHKQKHQDDHPEVIPATPDGLPLSTFKITRSRDYAPLLPRMNPPKKARDQGVKHMDVVIA